MPASIIDSPFISRIKLSDPFVKNFDTNKELSPSSIASIGKPAAILPTTGNSTICLSSVSSLLSEDFDLIFGDFKISIALALKGNFLIRTFCGYTPPRKINENNLGFNWMTIKELDGEFRNLKSDPQLLEIEGVVAKRLPEEYNGNRLGHNWSISWLTDHLNSKQN